jgi:hypothetical protein
MAGQGRRPDHKWRERAAQLRAKGLTYIEIAKCVGVTKQAVFTLLKDSGLWQSLVCLIRELGTGLVTLGQEKPKRYWVGKQSCKT